MKLNEQQLLPLALQGKKSPHKHGYLHKKSGKKNTLPDHATVRWQKRWCVVFYNFFFYFESPSALKPQGVIFLEGAKSQQTSTADKSLFCFSIDVSSEEPRQYIFACETDIERESWIQACYSTSGRNLVLENLSTKARVHELEQHVESLRAEKEKLRHELSDQWTQVTRLKLELSSVLSKDVVSSLSQDESIKADSNSSSSSNTDAAGKKLSKQDLSKLVKLQAMCRSWLIKTRWNGFIRQYIAEFGQEELIIRNKLLWQFISAEEDYVRQMKTLVHIFLIPFQNIASSDKKWLVREQVTKIFCTCESILVLHQVFTRGLESRMKTWPAVQIDDLLMAIMTVVPVYVEYIKNLPTAYKTLAECKQKDQFIAMLKWYESKPECNGQTLEQFLYYPIRVIPNYIRNIHDLLKVTPDDHPERKTLQNIIDKLQDAQTFTHFLDEGENIKHTLEIERLIEGGCPILLNAGQKFIRHGVLKQLCGESGMVFGKREKIRHCFLFSRHLIVASKTVDGKLRLSKHNGTIPLSHCTLQEEVTKSAYPEHMNSRAFLLLINKNTEKVTYEASAVLLMAVKTTEKALWTSDISQM